MALSADEYRRAWERRESLSLRYNSRIISGTCVLETLAMVNDTTMRYVFVDDFGYAVSYCRQRLLEDLVPPDRRGSDASLERWWRMRSAFAPDDLARSWAAAETAFALLLDVFVIQGYTRALGERLCEVVNRHGLDLELGEVYVVPQDVPALLKQVGNPFVWWDDDVERPEEEHQPFSFANTRHRAILARRLREENAAD